MGLYNCARCDKWALSEEDPPSFDPKLPADSTLLLCEICTNEVETADLDEALDQIFGHDARVRVR